jgi:hypothetical protein
MLLKGGLFATEVIIELTLKASACIWIIRIQQLRSIVFKMALENLRKAMRIDHKYLRIRIVNYRLAA